MRKANLTVAPITVMTVEDLEHLQSSVENFRLIDFLKDYASCAPDAQRPSLHDYMVAVDGKKYRFIQSKELADRAMTGLVEVHRRMFPNVPFPSPPPTS